METERRKANEDAGGMSAFEKVVMDMKGAIVFWSTLSVLLIGSFFAFLVGVDEPLHAGLIGAVTNIAWHVRP